MKKPTTVIKLRFTDKPPTKGQGGLYLTPDMEVIEVRYIREIGGWSVSDWPRLRSTAPWDSKTDRRSTVRFK